jgi:D-sedoheptulose 7-phosphate isomerase
VHTPTPPCSVAATNYLGDVGELLLRVDPDAVAGVVGLLWNAWHSDRTTFVIGNGGSAATASHVAWDLTRQSHGCGRNVLRARALTDNLAAVTAIANDEGAARIFADQIRGVATRGDVLMWLSCSCRSPSVVAAAQEALSAGVVIVGLGGCDGGTLRAHCDRYLHVPSHVYGHIEVVHLAIGHCIAALLRERALEAR